MAFKYFDCFKKFSTVHMDQKNFLQEDILTAIIKSKLNQNVKEKIRNTVYIVR